jgi:hypothetical protein
MTVNDFIKQLQQISPNKKTLPIVIAAPNGQCVTPQIKMYLSNLDTPKTSDLVLPQLGDKVTAIILTVD